jgi:hypothetical protein
MAETVHAFDQRRLPSVLIAVAAYRRRRVNCRRAERFEAGRAESPGEV